MDYRQTLEYMFDRLPMFQRIGPAAYKNNLDTTFRLDELYGHPHRKFKTIHVAGTNGKGSVSHMLAAILQSAGYKTGLYTSPHLKDFRERIRIDGKMIAEEDVVEWIGQYRTNFESLNLEPSFFELTVAMAFDLFAQHQIDIAVVEVGLGGRLDSTNIIDPEVSIITNIGLDHVALLGDSLEKIAAEKAGIIKPGIPAVVGVLQPEIEHVFRIKAQAEGSPLYFASQEYLISYGLQDMNGKQILSVDKNGERILPELKLDLRGIYQRKNVPAVLKVVDLLRSDGWSINDEAIYEGLQSVVSLTGLQGRWQIIGNNPLVVCDTGHNADGIAEVLKQISQTPYRKLHFIIGIVNDKDSDKILAMLPKEAYYYFTKASIPRALDEQLLAERAGRFELTGNTYPAVKEAYSAALKAAGKNDLVFAGGSTFVVAEIL